MADDNGPADGRDGNRSTVGSGRVDALFDEMESSIESLDEFADEVANVRDRIEANEGEVSDHVRNRITQDVGQFVGDLDAATERLREELEELDRSV